MAEGEKIMNDPLYKMMTLHPLWVKIIDTPEFQRLRSVKQLGFAFHVYPSATSTRFEHSIGVCYLADKMIRHLRAQLESTNDFRTTEADCLCVSVAGLCHDLGHGPFSHTWERFMDRAAPEVGWKHEAASVKIFNRIWQKLDIGKDPAFGLSEEYRKIICDLITGEPSMEHPKLKGKQFMFEIVANKTTGIDVDKWDYLNRDVYYLGWGEKFFEFDRLITFSQVQGEEDKKSIYYKDAEVMNIYNMFLLRWRLNRRAYKHRVARIIEGMFIDALLAANDSILKKGKKLSELETDLDLYIKAKDSIYDQIQELDDNHPATKLINRIETRDLYKSVGCYYTSCMDLREDDIEAELRQKTGFSAEKFYIDIVKFDWGKGGKNPVEGVPVYCKNGTNQLMPNGLQASRMLPTVFEETRIMCISRDSSLTAVDTLKAEFKAWFKRHEKDLHLRFEADK